MASSQLSKARETITTRDEGEQDGTTIGENTTNSNSVGELKIGKHVCPEEYVNAFTPMELEEVGWFAAGTESCMLYSTLPVPTSSIRFVTKLHHQK